MPPNFQLRGHKNAFSKQIDILKNDFLLYNSCIQTFQEMWDNSYKTIQITDASYNPKIFNIQSIYQRRRSRSEMDLVDMMFFVL